MQFTVFLPPQALSGVRVPVLYWLSGLTCTDENFITKAGAQRAAADCGVALVCPDTSPRGAGIEGETASWDFGAGDVLALVFVAAAELCRLLRKRRRRSDALCAGVCAGAGFYVDATQEPWSRNYRMYSYITEVRHDVGACIRGHRITCMTSCRVRGEQELPSIINAQLPVKPDAQVCAVGAVVLLVLLVPLLLELLSLLPAVV
jgi:S-formylglutathione hydrolase FrmB